MSFNAAGIICISVLLTGLISSCNDTDEQKARAGGEQIWFEEKVFEYGDIPKGSDGTRTFVFRNLGEEAVVINNVRSTCGCAVPEWPREPVAPGKSGKIVVEYNTEQTGTFVKSIYVYSTAANSPVKLQIKGKVFDPE